MHPLLKWAGGKRQLLPDLRQFYPPSFGRYIEPFFGSGAVFFDLYAQGRLDEHDVVLIDSNPDLIGCYTSVRDQPDAVATALDELAVGHAESGRDHYYDVRDRRFNPLRAARAESDGRIAYTPELAAMLLYLNRTGFNGLFRVNASGAFNVPAGRYERPRMVERSRLNQVSRALGGPSVRLVLGSFEMAGQIASPGDFLYVDPPYAPLSATSRFTSYTAARFGSADQQTLQAMLVGLATGGCHVLMSNSTAGEIIGLYEQNAEAQRSGLLAHRVQARRAINSKAAARGPIDELLVTNVPRQEPAHATLADGKLRESGGTGRRAGLRIR